MLHLSEAHQFLQRPTIQCVVIGRIPQAWDRNVTPPTVLFRRDDTKQIKPTINEAFVAFSGDIITDYNDLYCLFTWRDAAFVIREITNNKHLSKQLKTCVWIISGRNILTGCESKALDCPCKVGIAPLYRNSLRARQHCRLLFQVQEIVLRKLRRTHSNICVVLFWNCVVNTT